MTFITRNFFLLSFILFIALSPLPLGGNNPLAWSLYAFIIAILSVCYAAYSWLSKQPPPFPIKRIRISLVLFGVVCLWVVIQASPYTPVLLHHPLWAETKVILGYNISGAISINPYETETHLMRLLTYGMTFLLALQLSTNVNNAELILKGIAYAVIGYVLYAIIIWSMGSQTILWYDRWVNLNEVTSTFINRNHFAAYIGVGLIIWTSLFIREISILKNRILGLKLKYKIEHILSSFSGKNSLYLFSILIIIGALLLSRSRAGFVCSMFAVMLFVLIHYSYSLLIRGSHTNPPSGFQTIKIKSFLIHFSIFGIVMIALLVMGGSRLGERLVSESFIDKDRISVMKKVKDAVTDSPVLGTGLGTFPDIFPIYRDETISAYGRWFQAHNSYAEAIMELGLPVALMLFLAIALCIYRCFKGCYKRKKHQHFAQIALCVSALLLVHSLVDFPLQIPSITITFAAILGVGCAQSYSSREATT